MDFQNDTNSLGQIDHSVRTWTTGPYDDFLRKINSYFKRRNGARVDVALSNEVLSDAVERLALLRPLSYRE